MTTTTAMVITVSSMTFFVYDDDDGGDDDDDDDYVRSEPPDGITQGDLEHYKEVLAKAREKRKKLKKA